MSGLMHPMVDGGHDAEKSFLTGAAQAPADSSVDAGSPDAGELDGGDLDGGDWRHFLRDFVFQLIGAARPYVDDAEKELMLTTPSYFTPTQEVAAWLKVADELFPESAEESADATLVRLLRELRRHPEYHGLFEEQARELDNTASFGDDLRGQIAELANRIPEPVYKHSSEPTAVQRRVDALRRMQEDDPDNTDQFILLAEIFVRLDRADDYDALVDQVRPLAAASGVVGVQVRGALAETAVSIDDKDTRRQTIRQTVLRLLGAVPVLYAGGRRG